MTLRVELCPYGDRALSRLGLLIDQAKGDDPLAPVTVLVDSGTIALSVRRALAARTSAGGRSGVANVAFTTPAALAETMAAAALASAGRTPLTAAALRAAVTDALDAQAGPLLASTRHHASTIDALVLTYTDLRAADEATLARLAGAGDRAAEVVAVVHAVRTLTRDQFDPVDLFAAACSRCEHDAVASEAGPVLVYLPATLSPAPARFIRALAGRRPCTALIGVTGDAGADGLAQQMVDALAPDDVVRWSHAVELPAVDGVLSAPTADAEALLVLRDVMTRAEAGTPLEQMVIAHSGAPHYVTLIHNALSQAGIPFNGGGIRPLSATVAGRTLLGALSLADHDWRREDVAHWLHTGPIVQRGRSIPSTRWDALSIEAGINEGLEEWDRLLAARAELLRNEAGVGGDADESDGGARRMAKAAEAERCLQLRAFVADVARRLGDVPPTWAGWARWARELLHHLIGGATAMEGWPVDERAGGQAVEEALDRLAELEKFGFSFSAAGARAQLAAELAAPAPQTSRFGSGVWVTPLRAAAGLCVEVVYVMGMNDGTFPGRPSDDVLIPDRLRIAARGEDALPLRGEQAMAMRRQYLAVLAGATTRLLSFPRGNQRDGRTLRPSRWALDAIGTLTTPPRRLYSGDLEELAPLDRFSVVPSFMAAVRGPGAPSSVQDRDLRSLAEWTSSGRAAAAHYLCAAGAPLRRRVELVSGRRRGFSRFNGGAGRVDGDGDLLPAVLSATRVEMFSRCPARFFFDSVLGVVPRPDAERVLATDRAEYGALVHRILEAFVRPLIGLHPDGPQGHLFGPERLLALAEEELKEFEAGGAAPPGAVWQVEKVRLLRELRTFAAEDLAWRRREGIVTSGVEEQFGINGVDPVTVAVPGRQPVHFRGVIDRVDTGPDGSRIVTDYKSGSPRRYQGIAEDHFQQGSAIQLPVYALAAGASTEDGVRAEYWCVTENGDFKRFGFEVTAGELDELGRVVDVLVEAMDNGWFPANPGQARTHRERQCESCPYDTVCPVDRDRSWGAMQEDPRLARYAALVTPS